MKNLILKIIKPAVSERRVDVALLLLRVGVGSLMCLGHGLGKLSSYSARAAEFSDPLGVGSPVSLALAIFAEFFCSIAVASGFLTRLSVIPLIATMSMAAFVIHAADPFRRKELALVYMLIFLILFIAGAGRYSLDHLLTRNREFTPANEKRI
jgi:putative oxidoreductase